MGCLLGLVVCHCPSSLAAPARKRAAGGATQRPRDGRFDIDGRRLHVVERSLPRRREPSRPGHGMALDNVRERLRLMHDVAAQFDTQVADGSYRVQLVVPI